MKPQIKIEFPKAVHVLAWYEPKISYRIKNGENGKTLLSCNQGFERIAGLRKNLAALSDLFLEGQSAVEIKIYWVKNRGSKTILKVSTITV